MTSSPGRTTACMALNKPSVAPSLTVTSVSALTVRPYSASTLAAIAWEPFRPVEHAQKMVRNAACCLRDLREERLRLGVFPAAACQRVLKILARDGVGRHDGVGRLGLASDEAVVGEVAGPEDEAVGVDAAQYAPAAGPHLFLHQQLQRLGVEAVGAFEGAEAVGNAVFDE